MIIFASVSCSRTPRHGSAALYVREIKFMLFTGSFQARCVGYTTMEKLNIFYPSSALLFFLPRFISYSALIPMVFVNTREVEILSLFLYPFSKESEQSISWITRLSSKDLQSSRPCGMFSRSFGRSRPRCARIWGLFWFL